jgi:GGDEF domain-containing protein
LASGYLAEFQAAIQPLVARPADDPAIVEAKDEIQAAADALATQLNVVCAELSGMEFDPNDAEDAVDELTTALTQLLAVLHAGRDRLEEPLATLVRRAEEVPALADLLLENAHLSPLGRLCFDYVWVAKMRAGCVGMFDVDGLRHLNAARGPAVARRALQAIADLAREALPADVTLARLAGKQFVVCLPDSSAEGAAEIVECVRQRIEHARHVGPGGTPQKEPDGDGDAGDDAGLDTDGEHNDDGRGHGREVALGIAPRAFDGAQVDQRQHGDDDGRRQHRLRQVVQ